MKYLEPKSTISSCIDELENITKSLSNRNRLKFKEAQELNQIVIDLDNVMQSVEFYENHPLYMLLHRELHSLMKGDVPIYAFEIRVNLRPGNHAPARLSFDLFPDAPIGHPPNDFG